MVSLASQGELTVVKGQRRALEEKRQRLNELLVGTYGILLILILPAEAIHPLIGRLHSFLKPGLQIVYRIQQPLPGSLGYNSSSPAVVDLFQEGSALRRRNLMRHLAQNIPQLLSRAFSQLALHTLQKSLERHVVDHGILPKSPKPLSS